MTLQLRAAAHASLASATAEMKNVAIYEDTSTPLKTNTAADFDRILWGEYQTKYDGVISPSLSL